jgi:hypothetical protein
VNRRHYRLRLYWSAAVLWLLAPSCLLTFRDWPDAQEPVPGGSSGSATAGSSASNVQASFAGTSVAAGRSGLGDGSTTIAGSAGAAVGGVAVSASSGATSGGHASGGSASGSGGVSAGGASTAQSVPQIRWLTLDGNRADSSDPTNAVLDVNGVFLAKSDQCANWKFDPSSRCMSGTLCDASADSSNWGVAIEFVFRYTDSAGTSMSTTLEWDPTSVGVIGVAYQVTASTLGDLQLWILQMDPQWGGRCTSETCEIDGPPWGTSKLSSEDVLYFDHVSRDNWGGSGEYYTFDRTKTSGLQFKVPAISASSFSFHFCVARLGLIVG